MRARGTYPVVFASRSMLSLQMTCPQAIIIGGFCALASSFETGHANTEWKRLAGGSGSSIWCGVR
jgi:hypothetical protein